MNKRYILLGIAFLVNSNCKIISRDLHTTQRYENKIISIMQEENGPEAVVSFVFEKDPVCILAPKKDDSQYVKRYFMPMVHTNRYLKDSIDALHTDMYDIDVIDHKKAYKDGMPGLDVIITLSKNCRMRKVINHDTYHVYFLFQQF